MFMKKLDKRIYSIIMYLIMGVLTTLVNIVAYWVSAEIYSIDYRIATTIAWIAAVLFAYFTNKHYVFESKTENFKDTFREFVLFFGFRFLSFLMDLAAMIALVDGLAMGGTWAKVWSNVIVLIANYIFSKFFIFKKK